MKLKVVALSCALVLVAAAGRLAAQDNFPAIQFTRWTEPKEHAFTVDIPRGWSAEGGVNWLSPIDPQGFVRVQSPNKKILIYLGDPEILTRQVPTPAGRMQSGVNEGQVFRSPSGGPALLQRYMTGQQYAQAHVAWRYCRDPKWVVVKELPEMTAAMAAAIAIEARKFNMSASASSGEASYTCGDMQGAAIATTTLVGQGGPIQIWGVYRVAGFQSADPLHSMEARYMAEHMLASIKIDQQWQNSLDRKTMELTGAVMSMQNAALQSSLAASRQQNETLSRMNHPNAGVPSRSTSGIGGSSGSGRDVNTTLGTAHVCDAIGRCKTVSNTADTYYMDHSGNVRAGSSNNGPPDNSGVWSRLY